MSNRRWRTVVSRSGPGKDQVSVAVGAVGGAWWNMHVTWFFVVIAILVIAGAFLASLGLLGELPEVEPDLRPAQVDGQTQFDVVVRGYRMDEVDDELARLNGEIDRLTAPQAVLPLPSQVLDEPPA
jgi:uncharacterized membrane protein